MRASPFLLVVLLVCWAAVVNSQVPSPTPLKQSDGPQSQSSQEQRQPEITQTPPKPWAPLKLESPEKSKPKPRQPNSKEDKGTSLESTSPDWWTAVPTIAIAIFTGVLAWVTCGLLRANLKTAGAAEVSANTARDAFTKLERPYIHAFGAYKLEIDRAVVGGFEPFVRYSVANYGKTPAVLEDVIAYMIVSGETGPAGPPDDRGVHWLLRTPVFAPKERRDDLKQTIPEGLGFDHPSTNEICPRTGPSEDLFLRVIIKYRGPFAGGYETSACWRLDGGNNRFAEFGGREYNYTK